MAAPISVQARLSALEELAFGAERYQDLCLIFRRQRTGEILLRAGGTWDRLTKTYTDDDPTTGHTIYVKETQVPIVKKLAEWLQAFVDGQPRERVFLIGGNRRGGKTYITVACLLAIAISQPDAICWMVSPNLTKRDELERYVRNQSLPAWRSYRGMPEYRFQLLNGSVIRSITGDTADALKRGEATVILYNEPQDTSVDVATYGLPALIDKGGLALFAGNPPRRKKGEWFAHLRESIQTGAFPRGAVFDVPAIDNDSIDQLAREDVGNLLRILDPKAAQADDEGLWLPVGERAYGAFDKIKNVGTVPVLGDMTADLTKRRAFRAFDMIGGVDFQGRPWNAGVILKVFGDPKSPLYYAIDEIAKEGFEDEFLDEVYFKDYAPEDLLWIGDASGTWQDAHHSRGRVSFDIFKARRWRIEPPQKKKSDRGEHPRNPDVTDRLNLVNKLLQAGRLVIDRDKCPKLIEALKDCEINQSGKPKGKHAHLTDALGYALWWAEPLPRAPKRANVLDGIRLLDTAVKGPRML